MGSAVGEMKPLLATLVWHTVLIQARPSKIIFSDDGVDHLGHGDCDQGKLYWLEDGQCYDIGER